MKKAKLYSPSFFLGMFLILISACLPENQQSCEVDEICDGKSVQACCTDVRCYYIYNGVEYGDDAASLERLATALGCAKSGSLTFKEDIDDLVLRLEALGEIARTQAIKE
jgi:hypothetical protein